MENNTKHFRLELVEDALTKIVDNRGDFKLCIFDYDNFAKIKNMNDDDFNNGIYFLAEGKTVDKLYIGQTTTGLKRFNQHDFIKNIDLKYKIFFIRIDEYRGNINVLNHIEKSLIEELSDWGLSNKNKGNSTSISAWDEDYAEQASVVIRDFMKIYDFFPKKEIGEEVFFKEEDGSFVKKEKLGVKESVYEFIKSKGDWVTFKDINTAMIEKYKNELASGNWVSEVELKAGIRRDLQVRTSGYKRFNPEKEMFIAKRNDKGQVEAFKVK